MKPKSGRVFADVDVSLDGFVAGPGVSSSEPLGRGGEHLIWYGDDVNDDSVDLTASYGEVDARVLEESAAREGAVIMGRKTFDVSIDAWGPNPPIHKPCFVVTRRPSSTISTEGGTTFTFVTNLEDALQQALRSANGRDVGVMGGASIIRQFLSRGLLDELHLHLVPVLLGGGTRLFDGAVMEPTGLSKVRVRDGARATHLSYRVLRDL